MFTSLAAASMMLNCRRVGLDKRKNAGEGERTLGGGGGEGGGGRDSTPI